MCVCVYIYVCIFVMFLEAYERRVAGRGEKINFPPQKISEIRLFRVGIKKKKKNTMINRKKYNNGGFLENWKGYNVHCVVETDILVTTACIRLGPNNGSLVAFMTAGWVIKKKKKKQQPIIYYKIFHTQVYIYFPFLSIRFVWLPFVNRWTEAMCLNSGHL